MTNLYAMLADAQTQGSSDGDYFQPNQQGSIVIHKLIDKQKAAKRSVILVAEILESNAKVAGAVVQAPGTKVKKIYALSKYDWAINELKTDLVNAIGADEKSLSKNDIGEIFKNVFEGNALAGVVVNFNSSEMKRDGKPTLTKVVFSEARGPVDASGTPTKGHINEESLVAARAAKVRG